MLYVYLVTIFLTVSGVVEGPDRFMGTTSADWDECVRLSDQLAFTARPPTDAIGVAFYCETRTEGPK